MCPDKQQVGPPTHPLAPLQRECGTRGYEVQQNCASRGRRTDDR